MSTHKTVAGKILAWVAGIFSHAEAVLVPVILPAISSLLDGIKVIVTNPAAQAVFPFLKTLPPDIFDKITTGMAKVLDEFQLAHDLINATTPEEVEAELEKVFAEVKWPNDIEKQKFLSSFGARVLQEIQDHTLTFAQAVIDVEYFYENYVKTSPADAA